MPICLTGTDPIKSQDSREKTLQELYKPELRARLVFFRPAYFAKYAAGRVANAWLFEECKKTQEFHFPTLSDQLTKLQKSTQTVQEGDFFITRHSNLNSTHLVIHMVLDAPMESITEELSQRHNWLQGMRNLLATCQRFGVHWLVLPLEIASTPGISLAQKLAASASQQRSTSPLPPPSSSGKRLEPVFKFIKGLFLEGVKSGGQPTHPLGITFLIPSHVKNTSHLHHHLCSVFKPVLAKK